MGRDRRQQTCQAESVRFFIYHSEAEKEGRRIGGKIQEVDP